MMQGQQINQVQAVVFDVFGTILYIGDKRMPYRKLAHLAADMGANNKNFASKIMSEKFDLRKAALLLGVPLSSGEMKALENDLKAELESVKPYADTISTIEKIKQQGIKIAICSNLAYEYAEPVEKMLGDLIDVKAWSFEVGACKPDQKIYKFTQERLEINSQNILMIGDTFDADVEGPRLAGMQSLHLVRGDLKVRPGTVNSLSELPNLIF